MSALHRKGNFQSTYIYHKCKTHSIMTNVHQLARKFNVLIDYWLTELKGYGFNQLLLQPDQDSWSMGQVYAHITEETRFFFQQVKICLSDRENSSKSMSEAAKDLFLVNAFPNKKLIGPPEIIVGQPRSKSQLQVGLMNLYDQANDLGEEILFNDNSGKTKHPGHGYFDAKEWYQYAEMHLRHHIRQKDRIDNFLKMSPSENEPEIL